MSRQRILFISAFFPNPSAPNIATYNRQQLLALTKYYDIDAIVPIPWTNRLLNRNNLADGLLENITINYPTYYYTPYIFRNLYGYYYYRSINKSIAKLTASNSYDFIYSSWLYPDAWVAAKIAQQLNLPLYASVLGTDVNRLCNNKGFLLKKATEVSKYASKIVCVSESLRDKLISIGCKGNKLIVVQNGIDKNIFYPMDKGFIRKELGIGSNDKLILFVGNLKKEKGLGELCQAFSRLLNDYLMHDCKLIIIGAGKFKLSMEKMLTELNVLDKTRMLGERSLEIISKYMSASDVLCLPSYSEGQPNVVMEALSCHTRVVATAVGGTPDLDYGHGNMKLVPPKNISALTSALHEVLTDDVLCDSWHEFNTWEYNAAYLHQLFESLRVEG